MKVGFYLRGARGKLAGAVYQRGADGSTVAREIVKPKNPKTQGQMAQRMIFATATAAYTKMKAIYDHSWEGVQYGSKSQQEFMKRNLQMLRGRAANNDGEFLAKGVSVLMSNPYIISKGSLTAPRNIRIANNGVADGIKLSVGFEGTPAICTVANFCEKLSIDKGDQLTFVAITFNEDEQVAQYKNLTYSQSYFEWLRVTVRANANDDDVVYNGSADDWGSAVIVEGNLTLGPTKVDDGLLIAGNHDMLAGAVIRSKKSGDQWLRSNATMTYLDNNLFNFNVVLPSWSDGTTTLFLDSPYILNNADPGSPAPVATLVGTTVRATTATTPATSVVVPNVAMINGGKYTGCALVKFNSDGTKITLYEFVNTTTVKETTTEYDVKSLSSYLIELNDAQEILNYQLTVQPAS